MAKPGAFICLIEIFFTSTFDWRGSAFLALHTFQGTLLFQRSHSHRSDSSDGVRREDLSPYTEIRDTLANTARGHLGSFWARRKFRFLSLEMTGGGETWTLPQTLVWRCNKKKSIWLSASGKLGLCRGFQITHDKRAGRGPGGVPVDKFDNQTPHRLCVLRTAHSTPPLAGPHSQIPLISLKGWRVGPLVGAKWPA